MKKHILLSFIFLSLCLSGFTQQLAFPGAEGFGKYTTGGRGGYVIKVTKLEDYKTGEPEIPGSLRWALEQHKRTESRWSEQHQENRNITIFEPVTIVFDVAGTIWLKEDLKIKRDNLTIAGQSAPCGGICIAGRSVLFNGATGGESWYYGPRRKELIVRHIRFRPGKPVIDGVTITSIPADGKTVTYAVDMENYENVIFDHCSMSWANEECLATYDTKNVTFQYNIVSEGLLNAFHPKGARSYGGVWGGQFATFHHNLIAHNNSRTARFNCSRAHDTIAVIEYRNNVIYNWGNSDAACGGEYEGNFLTMPESRSEINLFNNYYKRGKATPTSNTVSISNKGHRILQCYDVAGAAKLGKHYIKGNFVKDFPTVTANNWLFGVQFKASVYENDTTTYYPQFRLNNYSPEVVPFLPQNLETAEEAFENVIQNCGATLPKRDAIDTRILNETKNGTVYAGTGIINDPLEVGGWTDLHCDEAPQLDTDNDGIPDEWESTNGLDPEKPEDRNNIAPSGYTMLEEYLNSIVPGNSETSIKNPKYNTLRIYPNPVTDRLNIEAESAIEKAEVLSATGAFVLVEKPQSNAINVNALTRGYYMLKVTFADGTMAVSPFIKK